MSEPLAIALPSKGRLREATEEIFARAGMAITRSGAERAYRGRLEGFDDVAVAFLSAPEIVRALREGAAHFGVTGEDLLRDAGSDGLPIDILAWLGFGFADVVVAVPECWFDVATMADLDEVSALFYQRHGRRLRVATKFLGLTRRFFADKGVAGYRIVESSGATEGAPASGAAEIIVDISTTGSTLRANGLKVLDDGVILRSEAVLACRPEINGETRVAAIARRLQAAAAAPP
ncbi:MAG: ATP phosphoribosyltransferase [Pseudomonadota bacterium]|nr:ATP phosphoribosyltransferase [Pseudomonadota bacterium]